MKDHGHTAYFLTLLATIAAISFVLGAAALAAFEAVNR